MMLRVTVTKQLADIDKSHFDFLKILALVELLLSPSHQFCSFSFYIGIKVNFLLYDTRSLTLRQKSMIMQEKATIMS